jgi:hypothetical protein
MNESVCTMHSVRTVGLIDLDQRLG